MDIELDDEQQCMDGIMEIIVKRIEEIENKNNEKIKKNKEKEEVGRLKVKSLDNKYNKKITNK